VVFPGHVPVTARPTQSYSRGAPFHVEGHFLVPLKGRLLYSPYLQPQQTNRLVPAWTFLFPSDKNYNWAMIQPLRALSECIGCSALSCVYFKATVSFSFIGFRFSQLYDSSTVSKLFLWSFQVCLPQRFISGETSFLFLFSTYWLQHFT